MEKIRSKVKVMQNFTVCISKPIREKLNLKKDDYLVLSMDEKGEVKLSKALNTPATIKGSAKAAFAALGGGEKFLKEERENWNEI